MSSRKPTPKAPAATATRKTQPPTPGSKEAAEAELRRLTQQARGATPGAQLLRQAGHYARAAALLTLLAVSANASVLALSPAWGAIPAAAWHGAVVAASLFAGWSANLALRRALRPRGLGAAALLALAAAWAPAAQHHLSALLSPLVGVALGPAAVEALTLGPLLALGTACAADALEAADLSGALRSAPGFVSDAAPGLGAYFVFRLVELESSKHMAATAGRSLLQTRVGFQTVLAVLYAALAAPSNPKLVLLGVAPALLHTALVNPHLPTARATAALNATLGAEGWSLVDRHESLTGYMSVLDNHRDGFRVMRCDHSLLGGEWTKFKKTIVGEPIYSVFTQLEAVRLVEAPDRVPDHEAKALNIGLGIGTTPSALIAHGIDTTIVEIDPVVYDFAQKYFGLPSNHTAAIADAVQWGQENMVERAATFDYIIHDVFTGGAEPIDLFTEEFLQSLNAMLKPNGVVAINYAGDFTLPPLGIVVNTVKSVFPSCRVFRESPQPDEEEVEASGRDFDNVIMFCVKVADHAVTFRAPREADYLQSLARRAYLLPKHEVPASALLRAGAEVGILRRNDTEKLAKWHTRSARGHWTVMRSVLPANIWESW
ncbi:hypothetical protein SLS62_004418 [Diatrype stigma]|uniref:Spermine spermidine synthase n=1 Tax=Diatrype stigma TaxID=117547 RepID=A0AAN9YTM8_9PEZI